MGVREKLKTLYRRNVAYPVRLVHFLKSFAGSLVAGSP